MVGRLGLLADSFIVFGYGDSAEMFDVRRPWYILYGVRGTGCMTVAVHIVLRSAYNSPYNAFVRGVQRNG